MKNLKLLRESHNLTQQQMADLFGLQRPTLSRYESGERQPDLDLLVEIAERFNVSVDYILGKTDNPKSLDEQLEGVDFALFGEIHDLTDKEKEDILNFVKFTKSQRGEKQ